MLFRQFVTALCAAGAIAIAVGLLYMYAIALSGR